MSVLLIITLLSNNAMHKVNQQPMHSFKPWAKLLVVVKQLCETSKGKKTHPLKMIFSSFFNLGLLMQKQYF